MKLVLSFFLFFTVSVSLWAALPKVAVLDTIVAPEVDTTLVRPVTDKVNEGFVNSGRYTVVARADLEQVYKEKELQRGWDVTEQDAAATGQVVGADFVVVTRISRLEDTYTISLKLIDVKNAIIVSQQSAETQGKKANLLQLSRDLSQYLATGQAPSPSRNQSTQKPSDKPAEQPAARKNKTTSEEPAGPSSSVRIVMNYAFANLYGELYDALKTYKTKKYPQSTFESQNGLELFIMANLSPNFYISGEIDTYDYKEQYGGKKYTIYNLFNAYFGMGLSTNFSQYMRLNYGGFIGSSKLTMKETTDNGWFTIESDGKTQATLGWGGELNLEIYPVSFFVINARLRAGFNNFNTDSGTLANDLMGNTSHAAINFTTVSVGAGLAF